MPVIESEYFTWSLLIITFCAFLAFYIWSSRKSEKKLSKKYDAGFMQEISYLQRAGALKFFIITGILLAIIASYDSRVRKLNQQLEELEDVINTNQKIEEEQKPAQNNPSEITGEIKEYYPPIMENNDSPEPAPVELKQQNTIQDIFGDDHSQKSASDIKGRYEELLATYFLMEKCGKTSPSDYGIIINSLQKEIASVQAPPRLQEETLIAAKGSYDELYSQNDCAKPSLKATEDQYNDYIHSLSITLQK